MNLNEFTPIFTVLCDYFGAKPSPGVAKLYFEAFKNWSVENFKRACSLICNSRVYPGLPKIPEIREMVEGKPEDQAALAYHTLIETIKRIGPWETVVFEDGAIGRAVEALGGWEQINEWSLDEWKFRKKDFEQFYLANLRSGRTEPITLYGAFDRINVASGQENFNKPVLVTKEMKFLPVGELKQVENLSLVKNE